jgi:hypothetical protein
VIVFICVTKVTWILDDGQITIVEKRSMLDLDLCEWAEWEPGVSRRDDCMAIRFFLEFCPWNNELAGNDVRHSDRHS